MGGGGNLKTIDLIPTLLSSWYLVAGITGPVVLAHVFNIQVNIRYAFTGGRGDSHIRLGLPGRAVLLGRFFTNS